MVFKTLHLLRPGLLKTVSHTYAQSVVAASQSSYASQNSSFASLRFDRFGKSGAHQHQNAFSSSANQPGAGARHNHAGHQDSGLAEYYAAWQRHQRAEDKDWQQFQFAKRIEWKPPTTVPEPRGRAREHTIHEESIESAPVRSRTERAHSTSAVDDLKKAVGGGEAEAAALAGVEEVVAEEVGRVEDESKDQAATTQDAASNSQEAASQAPTTSSVTTPDSLVLSEGTAATSLSEADTYAEQLDKLASAQSYAEVPAIFEAMLVAGVKPTSSAYNALLAAAIHLPGAKHQVVPKALDIYSDMLRRRVVPDTITFATLIELLSVRALDVLNMKALLEEKRLRYGGMEEKGRFMFQSNEAEFDILAEDDSLSLAVKMFDVSTAIHSRRAFPESTYHLLVSACAEQGKVADMIRIYTHMEAQNVTPLADMFVPMIHAFGTSGDLRSAVECYDEYKTLAISSNTGELPLVRKDEEVYAALIKAYNICDRPEGGSRFLARIEAETPSSEKLGLLRDTVSLRALLPEWLKRGAFTEAFDHVAKQLSGRARDEGMAAICVRAADSNQTDIASKAFDILADSADVSAPAMAMSAMYIRSGNLEAAETFWAILELADAKPHFIEPTAMHTVALVGSGYAEQGLRQGRQMFARIRDSQIASSRSRTEVVEQIDEAVEVIGQFMIKRGIALSPTASMELMWTMIDNGGLVTPVAAHLLAGLGPEGIAQLGWNDLTLLTQVQAGMILGASTFDIANSSRFSHMVDIVTKSGMNVDKQTSTLIENVLTKLDRPELTQRWQTYRYQSLETFYPSAQYQSYAAAPSAPSAYEDSFDPYASATDNKGSVAITDLLEKTHGRSSSHLNEALTKFRNMRRAGRHPRYFTYAKLIAAAAKEDRLPLAHDILALARQDVPLLPQYRIVRYGWVTILDAMVAACLTAGQRDLAARYHQDLLDMGAAPSANTFGLYITTLKESTKTFDEATEAVKIFLRAKSEGVEPSSFLYNALIGKLGKARRIDDCLFYFAEMRNLGIRPTSVTYGTIVNALCRVSDEKFAEELFEEMESMPNYKPRPAPYHSLMQFFLTTKRDRGKVLAYHERMRARNIQPTAHTYKLLIDAHASLEPVDMAAAEAVLAQMRRAGQPPEPVHHAALVHARGCVLHDMDGARRLFDAVLADPRARPQACLYQALVEAMVANRRVGDADAVLAGMAARGVEMTPYIANSLIHGWAIARDVARARAVYDAVAADRREPSTYEAMARAYMAAGDRDAAAAVVAEALARGYPAAVANKILELVGGGGGGGRAAAGGAAAAEVAAAA